MHDLNHEYGLALIWIILNLIDDIYMYLAYPVAKRDRILQRTLGFSLFPKHNQL